MFSFLSPNGRLAVFFTALMVFTCFPIWCVEYFINQDGSGHVYTASLMFELLRGNPEVSQFYVFNSISIPNSSGHWILVLFLRFFSAFTVTKIFVTLTYALFVAGTGWLRIQTNGRDGVKTSFLIGAALGFNWLWLIGFYNFTIGVGAFLFTLGLFYRWREKIGFTQAAVLSLLLIFVYLSHIISFVILSGGIFIIIFSLPFSNIKRTFLWTISAYLPILPLLVSYKSLSASGGGFSPVWRNLADPYSTASWLYQVRAVDPFILISRRTLPFFSDTSDFFIIFSPLLWICAAYLCLAIGTFQYYKHKPAYIKKYYPFLVLFTGSIAVALFAPDDFRLTNGGVLRERFLICGLLFFVPLFKVVGRRRFKSAAQLCLVFVVVFQTFALLDYALFTNRQAAEFLSASQALKTSSSIASVTIDADNLKFHAFAVPQLNNYNGIGSDSVIWDNYEMGHYLFPVVTRSAEDRRFIHDFTGSNLFILKNPNENFAEKLSILDSSLEADNDKIDTIILWGAEARVEAILYKWFEPAPYFQNGEVRLLRHK